jgi:anti-sigma regulatory factor (Ser/Thr protein kinase)
MGQTDETKQDSERPASTQESATFPGTLEAMPAIIDFVVSYARKQDFKEERIEQIQKALEEAIQNIALFTYAGTTGNIDVLCMIGMGQLMVSLTDYGPPFNMLLASDPLFADDYPGREKPSTRLMKKYMSSVESKRPENKNVLTLSASRLMAK